jgi:hypothetical protein
VDGGHVFIDESKRSGYLIVAATVSPACVEASRRVLRALLLPGQNALHFKKEKDGRRRFLLGRMAQLEVEARVYLRRAGNAVDARRACLEAAVFDEPAAARFVLDLAEGDRPADRRTLFEARQKCGGNFTYHHLTPPQEPLLWVADAIAWAWSHGSPWRPLVAPLVMGSREV